jgi:hypothetical protein
VSVPNHRPLKRLNWPNTAGGRTAGAEGTGKGWGAAGAGWLVPSAKHQCDAGRVLPLRRVFLAIMLQVAHRRDEKSPPH